MNIYSIKAVQHIKQTVLEPLVKVQYVELNSILSSNFIYRQNM